MSITNVYTAHMEQYTIAVILLHTVYTVYTAAVYGAVILYCTVVYISSMYILLNNMCLS